MVTTAKDLTSNWAKGKLSDFITLQRGYDLPEYDRKPGEVPVVTSSGVSGSHDTTRAVGPGVVMGRYGTIGQIYYVEQDFWPHNTTLFVTDFKGNLPHFIYYFLQTLDYSAHNDKTSVPGINRNHLYTLPVALPPLVEQRAIAAILGALDDKIALNRQMNTTLEGMARALFQSWFVDFDPVRAKAEGRAPVGMDADTAALFPASFEDSALGEMPVGWRVGTIGEVADNPRRSVNPQDVVAGTPYIGLEHMPQRSIALTDWGKGDDVESNKYLFRRGEYLFGKLRPYFHKVGIAPVDGICSTDILVVVSKAESWAGFVLFHISSDEFVSHTTTVSTGTRMPRTNWRDMASYAIAIPPVEVAGAFNTVVAPMLQTIVENVHQSRTLAETRDALLPKLVSGELRVGA